MKIDWAFVFAVLCKVAFVVCLGIICGFLIAWWW